LCSISTHIPYANFYNTFEYIVNYSHHPQTHMLLLTRKYSKKIDPFKQSSKILFHDFEQVDFDMFVVSRVVFFIGR